MGVRLVLTDVAPHPVDLGPIRPLPVVRRPYHHESPDSYIRRLALANGITIQGVARWLTEIGVTSERLSPAAWTEIWRRLGGLTEHHLPSSPGLADPTWEPDRLLCRRCTKGTQATGTLPGWGLICLDHRCWIDPRDGTFTNEQALAAERFYRANLAPVGLTLDSAELRFTYRIVTLAIGPQWIQTQQRHSGARALAATVFAAQVRLANELFLIGKLERGTAFSGLAWHFPSIVRWVERSVGCTTDDDEPWRAASVLVIAAKALKALQDRSDFDVRRDIVLDRLSR